MVCRDSMQMRKNIFPAERGLGLAKGERAVRFDWLRGVRHSLGGLQRNFCNITKTARFLSRWNPLGRKGYWGTLHYYKNFAVCVRRVNCAFRTSFSHELMGNFIF